MIDAISTTEKIAGILVVLISLITTLITAASASKKDAIERKQKNAEIESRKAADIIATEDARISVNERLQALQDKVLDDVESRFSHMRDELKCMQIKLETTTAELQVVVAENKSLRNAGILLIKGIEDTLSAQNLNDCDSTYLQSHNKLLDTLNNVKTLFQNGGK
jgi:hypothetical protein